MNKILESIKVMHEDSKLKRVYPKRYGDPESVIGDSKIELKTYQGNPFISGEDLPSYRGYLILYDSDENVLSAYSGKVRIPDNDNRFKTFQDLVTYIDKILGGKVSEAKEDKTKEFDFILSDQEISRIEGFYNRLKDYINRISPSYKGVFSKAENAESVVVKTLFNYTKSIDDIMLYHLAKQSTDIAEVLGQPAGSPYSSYEEALNSLLSKIDEVIACLHNGTYNHNYYNKNM